MRRLERNVSGDRLKEGGESMSSASIERTLIVLK